MEQYNDLANFKKKPKVFEFDSSLGIHSRVINSIIISKIRHLWVILVAEFKKSNILS